MKTSVNKTKTKSSFFTTTLFLWVMIAVQPVVGQVTVNEDSISIPTYLVEKPNPMPHFFEGRG